MIIRPDILIFLIKPVLYGWCYVTARQSIVKFLSYLWYEAGRSQKQICNNSRSKAYDICHCHKGSVLNLHNSGHRM